MRMLEERHVFASSHLGRDWTRRDLFPSFPFSYLSSALHSHWHLAFARAFCVLSDWEHLAFAFAYCFCFPL